MRKLLMLSLFGMAFTALLVCSSTTDMVGPLKGGNCLANGTMVAIGSNHGHVMAVTAGEVLAGAQIIYNLQGTATHNHTVTVTVASFMSLQGNQGVQIVSSVDDGHAHSVVINCQ